MVRFDRFMHGTAVRFLLLLSMLILGPAQAAKPHGDGITRTTLDNGLEVVIVPNHMAPVVSTVVNYQVGSAQAPPGFPGMAHAQEHMMFRGSKGLSADQLSAIAAAMGGDFNANTRPDVTQYLFTVPAQYLDVALHVDAIRMRDVLDSQALWQKERGAIEQEVGRDLSSPGYIAYTRILKQLFAGTPYAHNALGTKASFEQTTGDMLKQFYKHWYAPNNATLVIAGDVDPKQAIARVRTHFGEIKPHELPKRATSKLQPIKPEAIHLPTDRGYGLALLAYRLPGYASDDYAAARVLAKVLSNQRGPLYSRLVPTGKALDAQFQLQGLRPAALGLGVVAFTKGTDTDGLTKHLRGILGQIADHGISAGLVAAAKRQLATREEAAKDSIAGLARHWSEALAVAGAPTPAARLRAVRQVTVADVKRLANKYLKDNNAVLAVLEPEGSDAAAAGKGFGGEESFTPSHVEKVALPTWAAKPLGTIEAPTSSLQPRATTLANGLRVIVQPEHSSQTVHVYGMIRHQAALQTPPDKEGVDDVLDMLLGYGTQSMDRSEYQSALDAIGADTRVGTGFGLTVLRPHFERGLELLAANELHPRLPEKAFKTVRRQVTGAVAGHLQSPDFRLQQGMKEALYPAKDPSLRHATVKSVSSLKYQDVTAYYRRVFRSDLTTIVIIGDIAPKDAVAAVKKHFGDWQAKGKPPTVTLPGVPPNKPAVFHVPDAAKTQDRVGMAQTLGITRADAGYDALKLGNQVLSGGFYASRLYRELRAERGLVYYIHSGIAAERKRAHLSIEFGAEPDQVGTASRLITRALHKMQTQPVSDQELHRAQAELVRQVALKEASVDQIGHGILRRVDLGLPLDESVRTARHYLQLDAKAVQATFKRHLRPDDLVHASEGPKPSS